MLTIGRTIILELAGFEETESTIMQTDNTHFPKNKTHRDYFRHMSREQVQNIVWQIIYEQLGVKKSAIDDSKNYKDDLDVDSLDHIEIIIELENEFNIRIDNQIVNRIKTIGQTVDVVLNLLSGNNNFFGQSDET